MCLTVVASILGYIRAIRYASVNDVNSSIVTEVQEGYVGLDWQVFKFMMIQWCKI